MDNKQKHLEFIQAIISRMSGNLFFLKGWTISLITALFALFAKDMNRDYILYIVYVPAVVFWILDGYFLSQERLFRSLYNSVRKQKEKDIDFSMDTSKFNCIWKNSWLGSMFSTTLMFFYIPLIIVMLIVSFSIK